MLRTIDQKLGKATVSWGQYIDEEKGRSYIEKAIKGIGKLVGKPMPEGFPLGSLSIDDAAEISVDIATGWTDRLSYTRDIEAKAGAGTESVSSTQRDTTLITRKMQ